MKRLVFFLFVVFAFIYATDLWSLDKNGKFESAMERDESLVMVLQKIAKQIRNQTPIMVDEETQLTSVVAVEKTLNYYYKIVNYSAYQLDEKVWRNFALAQLNDIACKDEATQELIKMGVRYSFLIFGNDNRLVTRVTLDKYKCD